MGILSYCRIHRVYVQIAETEVHSRTVVGLGYYVDLIAPSFQVRSRLVHELEAEQLPADRAGLLVHGNGWLANLLHWPYEVIRFLPTNSQDHSQA